MRTTTAARLGLFVCTLAASMTSDCGGKLPPVVANVVGISVDCTKLTGQNLLQGEISKATTALASPTFDAADTQLKSIVADLESQGVAENAAWQDLACIVDHLIGEAFADARAAEDQDQLAAQRRDNGQQWMTAHRVTIVGHESSLSGDVSFKLSRQPTWDPILYLAIGDAVQCASGMRDAGSYWLGTVCLRDGTTMADAIAKASEQQRRPFSWPIVPAVWR